MALSNAEKLVNLGMPAELAAIVQSMIADAFTDADAEAAIAAKTEVAALTSGSDAAAIVAALQA